MLMHLSLALCVGIDLATRPKGRVELPHRALIGGAQPVWLVGPCRPRYKEREGCRGSHYEVRRHKPLPQKPYRSREARGRREAPPSPPRRSLPRLPSSASAGGGPKGVATYAAHRRRRIRSPPTPTSLPPSSTQSTPWRLQPPARPPRRRPTVCTLPTPYFFCTSLGP